MSDQAYLELWELTKSYPSSKGEAVIVKDVNFKFRKGEFVTVIGHSGCGKSTILMMVAGLSTITSGAIILAGKELNRSGTGSRCGLPVAVASAVDDRVRERDARRQPGLLHREKIASAHRSRSII